MIGDFLLHKEVGSLLVVEFKPLLTVRSGLIPQMSQCDLQDEVKFSESTG
jgi:hypothetical protein